MAESDTQLSPLVSTTPKLLWSSSFPSVDLELGNLTFTSVVRVFSIIWVFLCTFSTIKLCFLSSFCFNPDREAAWAEFMEFFKCVKAVKLRSHLAKYLVANDDVETVRQSRKSSSNRAVWLVEMVEGKTDAIRLKSCHGRYLSATDLKFLLGVTGKKVIQTKPGKLADWIVQWEPVRDGDRVKLMSWCGTYLRANGVTPPWRNSVTHDDPCFSSTKSWILWDVEAVEVPKLGFIMGRKTWLMSKSSLSSAISDEFSGSEMSSPVSTRSVRRSSTFQVNFSSGEFRSAMDFFHNAKSVRLRSHHDKYLVAEDDEESVTQDRNGSSKNARWSLEFVSTSESLIRLKSCYGKYLTASNQPFLLGMTGRKVLQTLPRRLDSSVEWEPIREGTLVKFKTRYGNFLRANGGLPPWRNSVTHDIPSRTVTQEWILWAVDVIEIQTQSSDLKIPALEHADSLDFNPNSPRSVPGKSPFYSRHESTDSAVSSPPKSEGRTIYYHVADESGDVDEETVEGSSFSFKGNGVEELTRKLEEETGMEGIVVCTRSPLNGNLFPLRLQLPPNNTTMHVVVVPKSSKVGKEFSEQRLL